ncbi:hypothetical protein TWF696_005010 [Orbilia brochopaga]|uniref:Uncharacterized protein n=1 Tax=Orbilia brochopaga TaxID=3140254 RepID=A0AAV9V2P9_9PEZI
MGSANAEMRPRVPTLATYRRGIRKYHLANQTPGPVPPETNHSTDGAVGNPNSEDPLQ